MRSRLNQTFLSDYSESDEYTEDTDATDDFTSYQPPAQSEYSGASLRRVKHNTPTNSQSSRRPKTPPNRRASAGRSAAPCTPPNRQIPSYSSTQQSTSGGSWTTITTTDAPSTRTRSQTRTANQNNQQLSQFFSKPPNRLVHDSNQLEDAVFVDSDDGIYVALRRKPFSWEKTPERHVRGNPGNAPRPPRNPDRDWNENTESELDEIAELEGDRMVPAEWFFRRKNGWKRFLWAVRRGFGG